MNDINVDYLKSRLNLVLAASFSTIFLAAIVYKLQSGYEYSYSIKPFLNFAALAIIIYCGSFLTLKKLAKQAVVLDIFAELIVLMVVSFVGFLLIRLGIDMQYNLLYFLSLIIFVWVIIESYTLIDFRFVLLSVAIAFSSLLVYGDLFQSPLYFFKILNGTVHDDVLFHASLSSMIGNYGTSSIGLDGHETLKYHWLSHLLFAGINKLTINNSLGFYNLGYPILIIPMLYFALCRLVNAIGRFIENRTASLLFLAAFTFFSSYFIDIYPFSKGELLFAESFILSIIFVFFLGIYLLRQVNRDSFNIQNLNMTALVTIAIVLLLIALIKVSTAIVITSAFCIGFFLSQKNRKTFLVSGIIGLLVAATAFFFLINFTRLEGGDTSIVTRVGRLIRVSHGLFTLGSGVVISFILFQFRTKQLNYKALFSWVWNGNFLESFLLYASIMSTVFAAYASYNSADTAYFGVVQLFLAMPILYYAAYRYFDKITLKPIVRSVVLYIFFSAGILSQFELYADLKASFNKVAESAIQAEDDFMKNFYLESQRINGIDNKASTALYIAPELKARLRGSYVGDIKRTFLANALMGLVQIEGIDFEITKSHAYGMSYYMSREYDYHHHLSDEAILDKARKINGIKSVVVLNYQNNTVTSRTISL